MADVDPLKTQRAETVYVDASGRTVTGTCQWLLENSVTHPVTTGNTINTFIAGQDGFAAIAKDIEAAKDTIYLVCWGFDPGMALVRNQSMTDYPWANGEPYGELLKRKAKGGPNGEGAVKVRLLVWYSKRGSAKQNSLVGYVVPDSYIAGSTISETWDEAHGAKPGTSKPLHAIRQDYCTQWWREATSGQIPNLEVRCRDGVSSAVKTSLADEVDPPSAAGGAGMGYVDEKELIENWATHHQKPILIDYAYADPADKTKGPGHKAVGYVMGLNSVSDYWDTAEHAFDSPLRELALPGSPSDDVGAQNLGQVSRKPLRDYAARIEGEALQGVHQNFARAWNRAQLLPKLEATSNAKHTATRSADLNPDLLPAALAKTTQAIRLQVLRTQPEEALQEAQKQWPFDKSIKHAYFQASSMARNYLYLENQYFFYEEWARHLKANREKFMDWVQDAGQTSQDARLLHLMVVIPAPEDVGMVPRTYDTLKSLGAADSMPQQHAQVEKHKTDWFKSDITKTAMKVKAPTLDDKGVLLQDGKSLGLKVLVAKLVAHNQTGQAQLGRYRDIYIHSKLMLADDEYMTLGSANLNQRSMSADSEINIATTHKPHNQGLRQRVWAGLTDGDADATGGQATPQETVKAFKRWQTLADKNKLAVDSPKSPLPFQGFLVKFEDTRTATDRVG